MVKNSMAYKCYANSEGGDTAPYVEAKDFMWEARMWSGAAELAGFGRVPR